ncbi:MAG: hypothetical protein SGPRY_009769 [Prymnesium sp.]
MINQVLRRLLKFPPVEDVHLLVERALFLHRSAKRNVALSGKGGLDSLPDATALASAALARKMEVSLPPPTAWMELG